MNPKLSTEEKRIIIALLDAKEGTDWGYNKENAISHSKWGYQFESSNRVTYKKTNIENKLISCEYLEDIDSMKLKIITVNNNDEIIDGQSLDCTIDTKLFYKFIYSELKNRNKLDELTKYSSKSLFDTQFKLNLKKIEMNDNKIRFFTNDTMLEYNRDKDYTKENTTIHLQRKDIFKQFEKIRFLFSTQSQENLFKMIQKAVPSKNISKKNGFTPLDLINSIEPTSARELDLLEKIDFNKSTYGAYGMGKADMDGHILKLYGYIDNLSSGYRSCQIIIDPKDTIKNIKKEFINDLETDFGTYINAQNAHHQGFVDFYKDRPQSGHWLD